MRGRPALCRAPPAGRAERRPTCPRRLLPPGPRGAPLAIGPIGEVILAGALAALALVVLDLGQILALQLVLGTERLGGRTWGWVIRTARAQLLWGFAVVISIEIILIEPWFLVPGIPLFLLGYVEIGARFLAERRARLL